MGFYDCRCMVTGVSLRGAGAVLAPLQQSDQAYAPITLALKGEYNRLGAIDGIEEEITNARLILEFFERAREDGHFVVDEGYLESCDCYPFEIIEDLVNA